MDKTQGAAARGPAGKKDLLPFAVNIVLILGAAAYFAWNIPFQRKKMNQVELDENRYIKMEWNLLQELKIQTDRQLLEKDREIAELRRRYGEALSGSEASAELAELEERLKAAEKERDRIAARAVPGSATVSSSVSVDRAPPVTAAGSLRSPALDILLLARIDDQEAALAELSAQRDELEKELAAIKAVGSTAVEAPAAENGGSAVYTRRLAVALDSLRTGKAEADKAAIVELDDLNAWALLRALANTQSVKEKYPDLLPAIEKYVTAFGDQRFHEGRSQAYTDSIKALESVAR